MRAVWLSPLEHSTNLHLNVQIKCFLPAPAPGRGNRYSLRPETWQQHPSPGASTHAPRLLPPAATGDQALQRIPITAGQSMLPGAELQGPFRTPAALTTEVCRLRTCQPAEKGVPAVEERSLTLPQQQLAGISVGPPPLPVCRVAFLCWPYNEGSQRPRAFIKTWY